MLDSVPHTDPGQLAYGSLLPLFTMSGIVWPIEGMPTWLQIIAKARKSDNQSMSHAAQGMPTTWAVAAGQAILGRGWGLPSPFVWPGFVVLLAWLALFMLLSIVGIKRIL